MATITLPTKDRTLELYATGEIVFPSKSEARQFNRIAYAAAHVVADPLADIDPWEAAAIDWDQTIAFRHYLWDLGLGIAEAMDTAQRGGGLDWQNAKALIGHALDAARRPARREDLLRRRHGSSRCEGRHSNRSNHSRLRRADRSDRGDGRPACDHGEPRARRCRQDARRLCPRLRPHPAPGQRAGHPSLARRDVRSGACRILGLGGSRGGDGNLPRDHP